MSTVYDLLARDLPTLLPRFARELEYGGRTLTAPLTSQAAQPRRTGRDDEWHGVVAGAQKLFVDIAALAAEPRVGESTTLDGAPVVVRGVNKVGTLRIITLEQTEAPTLADTCTVIHYTAYDGWNAPEELSREEDLPCRFTSGEETVQDGDTRLIVIHARVAFGPGSALVSLAVGDEVLRALPTSGAYDAQRYRVEKVDDERNLAGELLQRVGYLVKI